MKSKLTRKDLWLFAAPALVLAMAFLFIATNNYLIFREKQNWLKPRLVSNTTLIERPQPDGSIRVLTRENDGSEKLVLIKPPNPKQKFGLFKLRNLVLGAALILFLSVLFALGRGCWRLVRYCLRS